MSKNRKLKIILFSLVFFSALSIVFFFGETKQKKEESSYSINVKKEGTKTILQLPEKNHEKEIEKKMSVYSFMHLLKEAGTISYKERDYGSMGKFIEEINGVKNGQERNWIYYVNGKKAEIGISNLIISPGDVVTWKYESFSNQ